VDVAGSSADAYQFREVILGNVTINDGFFNLYVQDADLLTGSYPYFGWAWIRLLPAVSAPPPLRQHYITGDHQELVETGMMDLAGIFLPSSVTSLAA
jgi:hypothetical protein